MNIPVRRVARANVLFFVCSADVTAHVRVLVWPTSSSSCFVAWLGCVRLAACSSSFGASVLCFDIDVLFDLGRSLFFF